MKLFVRPMPLKQALPFVAKVHRRLPSLVGGLWAVCAVDALHRTVGAAVVGRPKARMLDDGVSLEVTRVAVVEGNPNACSLLYGACSRAARAMGAANMLTYTHGDEHGTSLKASGWVPDPCLTEGGEWSRGARQRKAAEDSAPKRRWWAPWSERAKGKAGEV